ncbi:purine-cytosine permease FCY21 [Colletotrichum paranaense]|uniref:Purine-cytosine permease FCY21 n=1 Tax=Colletotrichum paranaense TaxID=1914294 RepID=A0ABQ9S9I3_9PEZI|nr:purine-cytosine permease FCY21 [Colletotrichum paranaense]KAK1529852.1 purine-cytosine permease FCY21 [Colletotrichum paranaense]
MTTRHEKTHSVDLYNRLDENVDNVYLEAGSQSLPSKDWLTRLRNAFLHSAETQGVAPVPIEERSDRDTFKLFMLWLTANCTTLPLATVRQTDEYHQYDHWHIRNPKLGLDPTVVTVVIVLSTLLFILPVAWMGMMGPKTGMSQMVQTRYYFWYYSISRLMTVSFIVANSEVSYYFSIDIALLQIGTLIGYTIMTSIVSSVGIGLRRLHRPIHAKVGLDLRITETGLGLRHLQQNQDLLMRVRAAAGAAVPANELWAQAYGLYSVGGIINAMNTPLGGFGKFVSVLSQSLHPILSRLPRYIYSLLIVAIIVLISIVASSNFYNSLSNFLSVVGYWTASYTSIALTEHFRFRWGRYSAYNISDWDNPKALPLGFAALASLCCSFGLIVPSKDTARYPWQYEPAISVCNWKLLSVH